MGLRGPSPADIRWRGGRKRRAVFAALLVSAVLPACCLSPAGQSLPDGGTNGGADGGNGPAACAAAGGRCVIGPPTNCSGTILIAYDCDPPPVNPAGSICCLPLSDAGPLECSIDGSQYADGELNPLSPCQSCQLAISLTDWTNLSSGSACADGGLCSSGTCVEGCLIDG
jgi:hypothetical protein